MMSASAFASPVKGIPPALPATLDLKLLKQLRVENVITKEGARLCERFKVTDYAIGFTFKKEQIFDIKGNACPMGLPHIELCMFRISMFYNSVVEITNEKSFDLNITFSFIYHICNMANKPIVQWFPALELVACSINVYIKVKRKHEKTEQCTLYKYM